MDETLRWIEGWYADNCDGKWEHGFGVRIDTLDNPGWEISVDLKGTSLSGRRFTSVRVEHTESDWYSCAVQDDRFTGFGGPRNLGNLLETFRAWAERGA